MRSKLDRLQNLCAASGIHIERIKLPANLKAIYYADPKTTPVVVIDSSVNTHNEEACLLAEEIGHHFTSCGNLLTDSDLHKTIISKQEYLARKWAFKYMISLSDLVDAHLSGCRTIHDVAEHLEITDEFLREAVKVFENIYGSYKLHNGYRIYFDPLWVEKIDEE